MRTQKTLNILILGLLLPVFLTSTVFAQDNHKSRKSNKHREHSTNSRSFIITGDDEDDVSIQLDNGIFRVTHNTGDDVEITEFDMSAVGLVVDDAIAEVADIFEAMGDMQLDVDMDHDNRLDLNFDGQSYELDIDEFMTQIGSVFEDVVSEFDDNDWSFAFNEHDLDIDFDRNICLSDQHSIRVDEAEITDDLEEELDELRQELRELRRELRKLRDDDDR